MMRSRLVMGVVVAGLALAPASYALAEETSPELSASGAQESAHETTSQAGAWAPGPQSEEREAAPATPPAKPVAPVQARAAEQPQSTPASSNASASQVPASDSEAPAVVPSGAGTTATGDSATASATGSAADEADTPRDQAPEATELDPGTSPSAECKDQALEAAATQPAPDATAHAEGPHIAKETGGNGPAPSAATRPAPSPAGDHSARAVSITATAKAASPAQGAKRPASTLVNVYRLYNPNSGEHFYTTSLGEATHVFSVGWRWENAVYTEDSGRGQEVYRLYNPNAGAHFYTVSAGERNWLRSLGWRYEGVSWRASGAQRLFRLYNPNSPIGEHLYTASRGESDHLRAVGWNYEGYAWSYLPGTQRIAARWVVSPAYGSTERYWVSSDTTLAKNRFINPSEGTGYKVAAYATGSGAVVRNKTRVGSGVMFADNDGRLRPLPKRGWWNTSSIDGSPQWYYIGTVGKDASGKALTGALTGWLTKDGHHCYAMASEGYLARGRRLTIDNKVYVFDSTGAPDKYGYQNRAGFYRVSSNSVWLGHAGNPFNYVTPSRIGVNATREDCVNAFVQRAREYLGTPYVWDYAREPGVGVDCVGLVMQCAYATGMDLGDINPYNHYYTGPNGWHSHDANNLWNSGEAMHVGLGSRRRGDVISWPGHVAIYIGGDQIIEAYSPRTGVRQTSMWSNGTPRGVIRLFQ